jgi:tetratricopeptide (TPR) repeat protein
MPAACLVLAAALLSAPLARAGEPPDERTAQARALSQEASAQYAVGEFTGAAEKYQAAYKLKPDAALLYNAAQSYRMAGNNEKALLLYKNYVMFYPNAKNVANVEQQISKLQEAIAAQEKAKTQPPTTTEPASGVGAAVGAGIPTGAAPSSSSPSATPATEPPPAAATTAPAAVPAAPAPSASTAPATTLTATAPPAESEPIYKKWWLWTAVGVVVVGGVVAAVALSSKGGGTWATAPDFGPGAPGR